MKNINNVISIDQSNIHKQACKTQEAPESLDSSEQMLKDFENFLEETDEEDEADLLSGMIIW